MASGLRRLFNSAVPAEPFEKRAVFLAFLCHFVLFASYYILRPLRETMATVFGADQLQNLFTGTFVITLIAAPLYSAAAARIRLERFLPGIFWFWLGNILLFYALFFYLPHSRWVAAAYYWWFSVVNLFLVSVFWTLMADIFTDRQAARLFPVITAGSSSGAIAGPLITNFFVGPVGVGGLLLIAAGGFLIVIFLIHRLMAEKERLRQAHAAQTTTLDHNLPGNALRGFSLLMRSPTMRAQALFMMLMTWVATIVYFRQIELVAEAYSSLETRTVAFADVDLVVNAAAALIAIFGLGRLVTKAGVTWGLIATPLLMIGAFAGVLLSPSLVMVQSARALQRISQYAIARPSREILFTIADQESKYKAKNVIDTVVFRFGDITAAWIQAGLRTAGLGLAGVIAFGVAVSAVWSYVAVILGRRYEAARAGLDAKA